MTNLTKLIADLEAAEKGSRELDRVIDLAMNPAATLWSPKWYSGGKNEYLRWTGGKVVVEYRRVHHYTTSLDAALTLYLRIPERIPSKPLNAAIEALQQRMETTNAVDSALRAKQAEEQSDDASIFGYFDMPGQTTPIYDPGLEIPCPICLRPLSGSPRKTISLMKAGDNRSYFFRAHKTCWETALDHEKEVVEHSLIDMRSER